MATANYDEVTHSAGNVVTDWNSIDPLYKWDPKHFPERLSRLHVTPDFNDHRSVGGGSGGSTPQRRQKRGRNRNTSRFKTQPITFDEIKEVDEEPRGSSGGTTEHDPHKDGLKNQFAAFSRSMDGLVPGFPVVPPYSRNPKSRIASASDEQSQPEAQVPSGSPGRPPLSPTAAGHANGTGSDISGEPEFAAAAPGDQAARQETEAAAYAAAEMNPTLAHVQDISRARRKKRRSRKSIEEEPELEKIAAVDSQSAG